MVWLLCLVLTGATLNAQNTKHEFTIQQAVDYARKNNVQVKNALLNVQAQQVPVRPQPGPPPINALANAVGLDAQQTTAIQAIFDTEHQAMDALEDSIRPQRDAIMTASKQKIVNLLSADQLALFQTWQEAHRPPPPPLPTTTT